MKPKDFLRTAIFIVGFLLLNHFLTRQFVVWSRYDTEHATVHREFVPVQDEVTLVFLGDSHPQKSAKSDDIPGAYTLATSAESYPYTYYLMKYYLESGEFNPSVAVVQIDPHGFMSSRFDWLVDRDPAIWDPYMDYWEIDTITDEFGDLLPTIIRAKFSLSGSWDLVLEEFWPTGIEVPEPLVSGFAPQERDMSEYSPEQLVDIGHERAANHFNEAEFGDEVMVWYFQQLIDLLQAHDVAVVFVWYPVMEAYYDAAGEYVPLDDYPGTIEGFLDGRQPDLMLDYHDFFFGHPEYFADADHLNVDGAVLFTQDLLGELSQAGLFELE